MRIIRANSSITTIDIASKGSKKERLFLKEVSWNPEFLRFTLKFSLILPNHFSCYTLLIKWADRNLGDSSSNFRNLRAL